MAMIAVLPRAVFLSYWMATMPTMTVIMRRIAVSLIIHTWQAVPWHSTSNGIRQTMFTEYRVSGLSGLGLRVFIVHGDRVSGLSGLGFFCSWG